MKHIIDDQDKNKYEAYTKEEVLEVIQEAISSGELPEEINGFVITLKNPIDNLGYKIAFCTQAKYNELEAGGQLESNCYYYITDDTTYDDMVEEIETALENFQNQVALVPRTQELMRQEASEGATEITLNELTNNDDWVEISGYVRENTTPCFAYYFTHRVKIQDVDEASGIVKYSQSVIYPDVSSSDDVLIVRTRLTTRAASSWDYSKLGVSISNAGSNPSSTSYVCKILSVKELINY